MTSNVVCAIPPAAPAATGVARSHLLSYEREGALLEELFTHDGSGTLIAQNPYEQARARK